MGALLAESKVNGMDFVLVDCLNGGIGGEEGSGIDGKGLKIGSEEDSNNDGEGLEVVSGKKVGEGKDSNGGGSVVIILVTSRYWRFMYEKGNVLHQRYMVIDVSSATYNPEVENNVVAVTGFSNMHSL
ncbi:hypothetical protein Tco_1151730 [Tanacetum coccineum]